MFNFVSDATLWLAAYCYWLSQTFGEKELANSLYRKADEHIDPLFVAVAHYTINRKNLPLSLSKIQRNFAISYHDAKRLLATLEADNIISAPDADGNRALIYPNNVIAE